MKAPLAIGSPVPALGSAPAGRMRGRLDALVTLAVMAWFAAALGGMIGEMIGESRAVALAPAAVRAAARDQPTVQSQASARPENPARGRVRLI